MFSPKRRTFNLTLYHFESARNDLIWSLLPFMREKSLWAILMWDCVRKLSEVTKTCNCVYTYCRHLKRKKDLNLLMNCVVYTVNPFLFIRGLSCPSSVQALLSAEGCNTRLEGQHCPLISYQGVLSRVGKPSDDINSRLFLLNKNGLKDGGLQKTQKKSVFIVPLTGRSVDCILLLSG
jgi:hypothetical protein